MATTKEVIILPEEKDEQSQGDSSLPNTSSKGGYFFETRPVVKEGGASPEIKHL